MEVLIGMNYLNPSIIPPKLLNYDMKIKVVENPPVDPREFDLPESFSEENIEDVVEIFNTPLIGHYNWDYTDADTRIKKLYELGKKLNWDGSIDLDLSLIHISEPTRPY